MKVIFSTFMPFYLGHGGQQTAIEALKRELENLGVEVDSERWWDDRQTGDILHCFGRPPIANLRAAKRLGIKVVVTDLLGQAAARGSSRLLLQGWMMALARAILPQPFLLRLSWDSYREADAVVLQAEYEVRVARSLFQALPEREYVVPIAVAEDELEQLARPQPEEDYLVCMATIYSVKNPLLLAQSALEAQTPIVFLGKPYATTDPYYLEFKKYVDGKMVRHAGHVTGEEKYRWLRGARGFVLLSRYESGCIAANEAAAAGLPLLLSDLPWARDVYGSASGVQLARLGSVAKVAPVLKAFYQQAHRRPSPIFPVLTWRQAAEKYIKIYQKVLHK